MREYVLKVLASFLHGRVKEHLFHIWTGCGSNGKSKMIDLFSNSLGDYAVSLPVTMVTGKRVKSGAAHPELLMTRGARFVTLSESGDDDVLNMEIVKELSGGDKITCRGLYQEPTSFYPSFRMIMTCNNLPEITDTSFGAWRRIRVVEHRSRFVPDPDPNNDREFKQDTSLGDRMERWRATFISLLLVWYARYLTEGLVEPPEVCKVTDDYKAHNNLYLEFLQNHVEDNPSDSVQLSTLKRRFQEWLKAQHPHRMKLATDSKECLKRFSEQLGEPNRKRKWPGKGFIRDDEEDDSDCER